VLPYVLRRLFWMVPTLLGIAVVTFALMHLAPGDPTLAALAIQDEGGGVEAEDVAAGIERFRAERLLDEPLWRQFAHYMGPFDLSPRGHAWFGGTGEEPWGGLLTGDLHEELLRPSVRVGDQLGKRLLVTVPLAAVALLLGYAIALALGIHSAIRRGKLDDTVGTVGVLVLYAVPTFWAGLLLQIAFGAAGLDWLPVFWLSDPDPAWSTLERLRNVGAHALLPVATLALGSVAYLSRQMRAGMVEEIAKDYVRTARAKGLSERSVVLKHTLRNSLIPVLTLFASVLPFLIGGSVVVEVIFDVPGMGRYAYEGLLRRDYNVVMATTLVSAVMTLVGILLSDLAYAWADPRIRFE